MKKIIFSILLIVSTQSVYAICSDSQNPNAMLQCYTNEYIELEGKLNKLQLEARKVIDPHDVKQMQATMGAWKQYMLEQCELESRVYARQIMFRQTSTAICRYTMLKSYSTKLAKLVKQLAAVTQKK